MTSPSGIELQVRLADIDGYGHVNNSIYIAYLQHALAKTLARAGFAWETAWNGETNWQLLKLAIEYRQPAVLGDQLAVQTWLEHPDPFVPCFGFEILRRPAAALTGGNDHAVVRAVGAWSQVERKGRQAVRLPVEMLRNLPTEKGVLPRSFELPHDQPSNRHFTWQHRAGVHEIGPDGRAQVLAIYNWFEEALFDACDQAGWPLKRRLAADTLILQTRHDTHFYEYPRAGDDIQVISRVVEFKRLRGSWMLDLTRITDGTLLARDISTGVFLDLEGKPSTPAQDLINDLLSAGAGEEARFGQ